MMSTHDPRLQDTTSQMRHAWFVWGIIPLAAAVVLTLLVVSLVNAEAALTPMGLERRFQFLLAISAGLFLIGFSLDSHWTGAQKLAKRLALAAGLQPDAKGRFPKLTARQQQQLADYSDLVFKSILSSVQALTVIGGAIAVVAVLAAAARLGLSYAVMLLVLAASYQLFVFSRHSYYREVMVAAAEGKLVVEQEEEE
jgi:hypothetical protein